MKKIDKSLLDETTEKAKSCARLRMNYNFHERPDDPVNRLLNALEPGTYIRPHRHLHPPKEEIFLLLRGKATVFTFDDRGAVTEVCRLDPAEGSYGIELKPEVWHSLLVEESGSVIYEVKQGPFAPLQAPDLAPWSPEPEDREGVKAYLAMLEKEAVLRTGSTHGNGRTTW